MTRRIYAYFVLTFILGMIAGGAATVFYAWNWGHWHRPFRMERVVRRMAKDLQLTDPQVQQLRQIMDETMKKNQALQSAVRPQFDAIREESHSRIRQTLTPEQTAKFDEMVKRFERRLKERHDKR